MLGSVSPAHKESCKDLEPFISRSPATPPLDPAKDDYVDKTCPGKSCLEEAEELAGKSPTDLETGQGSGRGSGGRGSAQSVGTQPGRSPGPKSPAKARRSPAVATAPTGRSVVFSWPWSQLSK